MEQKWNEDRETLTRERRERRKTVLSWAGLVLLAIAASTVAAMALLR